MNFLDQIVPDEGVKFVAARSTHGLEHFPCASVDEMVTKALEIVESGRDVYFACAAFQKPKYQDSSGKMRYRTAENAISAKAFWLDLDVGPDKDYLSQEDAIGALRAFCKVHSLPRPMILSSGYGIHCYWPLTEVIKKEAWLEIAKTLKELTKAEINGLSADPARTSDITSLLRPPETINFKKGGSGKAVKILVRGKPVAFEVFAEKIRTAKGESVDNLLGINLHEDAEAAAPPAQDIVKEALTCIDPDAPYDDWWKVIAALADAYGETGRDLARNWSSGDMRGRSASKFCMEDFNRQFSDCLGRSDTTENKVGLGTVFHLARGAGWTGATSTRPDWLEVMNRKYAWIEKECRIFRLEHGDFVTPTEFQVEHSNAFVEVADGDAKKQKEVGRQWIKDPGRRQHTALTMRPGEGEVTHDNCLNTWKGFAVEPHQGDIKPFLKLLKRLVPDRQAAEYVIQWLAHLTQNPGVKMNTGLVFWSRQQGVGKNLLFECFTSIIGSRHATIIGQPDLARDFNGWAKNKVFVIGDEVSSADRRHDEDKLKGLITSTTVQINEKYQPAYETENLMNFVFLSNHSTAMFVGDHDRRYFVWNIEADPLPDDIADDFVKWRDAGGLAALLYFFQKKVDITEFNPKARAPETVAKREMVADNRSELEEWAASVMASSAKVTIGRELATAAELGHKYAAECERSAPSAKAVNGAFKKLGACGSPHQVPLSTGRKFRVLALDRPEFWKNQPTKAWAEEMKKYSL